MSRTVRKKPYHHRYYNIGFKSKRHPMSGNPIGWYDDLPKDTHMRKMVNSSYRQSEKRLVNDELNFQMWDDTDIYLTDLFAEMDNHVDQSMYPDSYLINELAKNDCLPDVESCKRVFDNDGCCDCFYIPPESCCHRHDMMYSEVVGQEQDMGYGNTIYKTTLKPEDTESFFTAINRDAKYTGKLYAAYKKLKELVRDD